jgi:small subunit ribosomal protein S6
VSLLNKYELMLIIDPGAEDDRKTEIVDRVRATIEKAKGKVAGVDEWGKRKLAYEIKGQSEGTYSVVTFTATPTAVAEVERVLGITDDVLRFMTVRLDAGSQS